MVNPAVVAVHAAAWVGTPWHPRAAVRGVGADCVGLVRGILAEVSARLVTPPPFRPDWAEAEVSPIVDAANRHLDPVNAPVAPAPGQVVAFAIGSGRIAHVGVRTAPDRIVHVCTRRGAVETRAPWRTAGTWAIPLAAECEPGRSDLTAEDLLAIVQEDEGGAFYTVQDMRDATPLARSRPYPNALTALAAVPPGIVHVERV